jgi:hypothetical protein
MGVVWKQTEAKIIADAERQGHVLAPFESKDYRPGVGHTWKVVNCKRCGAVCEITFCVEHGFHVRKSELTRPCESLPSLTHFA